MHHLFPSINQSIFYIKRRRQSTTKGARGWCHFIVILIYPRQYIFNHGRSVIIFKKGLIFRCEIKPLLIIDSWWFFNVLQTEAGRSTQTYSHDFLRLESQNPFFRPTHSPGNAIFKRIREKCLKLELHYIFIFIFIFFIKNKFISADPWSYFDFTNFHLARRQNKSTLC